MNGTAIRLTLFASVLAVLLAGGWALGAAVGPLDVPSSTQQAPDGQQHGDEHGGS